MAYNVAVQLRGRLATKFSVSNLMTADRVTCNGLLGGMMVNEQSHTDFVGIASSKFDVSLERTLAREAQRFIQCDRL
jgi:hypothetical protein